MIIIITVPTNKNYGSLTGELVAELITVLPSPFQTNFSNLDSQPPLSTNYPPSSITQAVPQAVQLSVFVRQSGRCII